MQKAESLEAQYASLTEYRHKLQIMAAVVFALAALAMAFWLFHQPVMAACITGAVVLFYVLWLRKQRQRYVEKVAELNIVYGLGGQVRYTGDQGISQMEFERLRMAPIYAGQRALMLRHGFAMESEGWQIYGWETTWHYLNPAGGNQKYVFMSGSLLKCSNAETAQPDSDILLIRDHLLPDRIQSEFITENHYHSLTAEGAASLAGYHLYSGGGGEITEPCIKALAGLCSAIPSLGIVRVAGNTAAVFLAGRFYSPNVKLRDLPTEAQLRQNPLPELAAFQKFIGNTQKG